MVGNSLQSQDQQVKLELVSKKKQNQQTHHRTLLSIFKMLITRGEQLQSTTNREEVKVSWREVQIHILSSVLSLTHGHNNLCFTTAF